MIEFKDYQFNMTSKLVYSDVNNISGAKYTCRAFFDKSNFNGKYIPYFYGSSTNHKLYDITNPSVTTVVNRGYCYVQVIPLKVSSFPLNTSIYTYFSSLNGLVYAYEVESTIDFIINTLNKDVSVDNNNVASIYITGTSRGAIAACMWSAATNKLFSEYGKSVIKMYVNAPISGGSGDGNWYNAELRGREQLNLLNRTRHKTIVTYAKNDRTHANRSITEVVNYFYDNKNVEIVVPANPDFTHTYPSIYPTEFFNSAIDYFEN